MENSTQMASLSSSNNNYGENINIPFSVLKELNKALSDSANVISENTKALSELRNEMKELKDEFKELKQQLTNKPSPHEVAEATRKRNIEDQSSNPICAKKTKVHTDFDANFNSLSDDLLSDILEFVGRHCYATFGLINTRFNQAFTKKNMAKKTFMFGYAPFSMICKESYGPKSYYYFEYVATGIVKYNRIDLLRHYIRRYRTYELSYACRLSALEGRFDIIREVIEKSNNEVINYLKEDSVNICKKAAKGDNFEILKWLHAQDYRWDEETFNAAAKNGNLSMLKWMFANDRNDIDEYEMHELCENAAKSGNLKMLKWLQSEGWDMQSDYIACCAADGLHMEVLKWLCDDQDCNLSELVFECAADGGSVEILEYLKAKDCPWEENKLCGIAASNGHLNALKWLRDQGCPLNNNTFASAVYSDNIEILEWLKQNKCPWNGKALVEAHRSYKPKALQWLLDNGCPEEYPEEEGNQFF